MSSSTPDDRFAQGRPVPPPRPEAETSSPSPDDRFAQGRPVPSPRPEAAAPLPAPELPSLSGGGESGLSSLAQSAREKQINTARGILIAIGVITIVVNIIMLFIVHGQIDESIRKVGVDPRNVPPAMQLQVATARLIGYGITGAFVAMGAAFIILGALVRKYPVPCTIISLVLYVGGTVVTAILDLRNIGAGWLLKIIIIVALVKAVQAALASEREKREALAGFGDGA
jgi:hypothetical protein